MDEILQSLSHNRHNYRHCMFWERLHQCWSRLGDSPDTDALLEDIFQFKVNPESQDVYDLIMSNLAEKEFWMDSGHTFWNQIFRKHPIIFVSYASRMLLVFAGDHSPFAMSFRMDALYGFDWIMALLPTALLSFGEEFLESTHEGLTAMFNRVFVQVLSLLKVPDDLPIDDMTDEQLDVYQREWNIAPEILCAIALAAKRMQYPLTVPDAFSEYLSTNLDHIQEESLSFLLLGIRSSDESYLKFQAVVLDEVVAFLQHLCSSAQTPKPEEPASDDKPKEVAGTSGMKRSNSDPELINPHTKAGAEKIRSYVFWAPEGDKNVQHTAVGDLDVIDAIHTVLKDLIVVAEVNRPALVAKMPVLKPLLTNLLAFPLSPALRCSVCVILSVTHRHDADMVDLMWQAALKGPRPIDSKIDHLVARETFVLHVCSDFGAASKRPRISAAEIFDFAMSDTTPEAYQLHKDMLEAVNPFVFELAQIPEPVLQGIDMITDTLLKLSPEREIKHNMLDVLTDFIKRGGKQLKKYAPKITAALNRLCEMPGYELAVYSLGLWLGKYIEGKFGTSIDNVVLFHLCRDVGLRCLQRMKGTGDLRTLSLPIYTLVRVCMFGFRSSDASICQGLPELILAHSPLPMAREGDIIAFSTNSYIFDMINMIPDEDMDDEMNNLILDFYRALVLNEGLIGTETVDLIKLNPNVMAHIAAAQNAPK
jgi:hypothetical protein